VALQDGLVRTAKEEDPMRNPWYWIGVIVLILLVLWVVNTYNLV
jgi:hypothetical protein